MNVTIMIVEDEEATRQRYAEILSEAGYQIITAGTGDEAIKLSKNAHVDIALLDWRLSNDPDDMDGLKILEYLKQKDPNIEVIVITAYPSAGRAHRSSNFGAEYISKPIRKEDLLRYVQKVVQRLELKRSGLAVSSSRPFPELIGTSEKLRIACEKAAKIAKTDATILLLGETGTGKTMMARLIHQQSRRNASPFVVVDCPNIPEDLVESELFGHERGAFTDAKELKIGIFESVGDGTIFLDEVGELPIEVQPKLLGVMENMSFRRLGSNKDIKFQARLIFATEKDLDAEVKAGKFRTSLYYRINAVRIHLPSLSESKDDIPLLADHFIKHFTHKHGLNGKPKKLSQMSLKLLQNHYYKGNTRELRGIIENALLCCDDETIEPRHLELHDGDFNIESGTAKENLMDMPFNVAKKIVVAQFEKEYLLYKLKEAKYKISAAADLAGLDRKTFSSKIKEYGIEH